MGTMTRAKTPIPFGGGTDRASGILVVEPAAFSDLRDVHLRRGKAVLRQGLAQALALAGETDVLAIGSIRSQGIGAVVTYRASTNTVRLYEIDGAATTATFIGDVWTLATGADIPRVIVTDSYDRLFIAHETSNAYARQATRVYDLFAATISDLTGNLDGVGDAPIRFRGVKRYLAYLCGWGFGTNTDQDRPEIVRMSLPADPLTFDPQSYFVAGQRGDPVMSCSEAGTGLAVRKQSESYDIFGYDRTTFGIRPADLQFGQAGCRLGVTVGSVHYFWSLQGPRRSSGGETEDLSVPLDLDGPAPDALVTSPVDFDLAFAIYNHSVKEILFCFGGWAYVLHIEDPSQPRWSYRTMNVAARCAGVLYTATQSTLAAALIGSPSMLAPTYTGDPEPTTIVPWTLSGALFGAEQVEIWSKRNDAEVLALLTTALLGSNNDLKYSAVAGQGDGANGITVAYVDPGAPSAALSVVVAARVITVNLATDGGSVITTTAAQIAAAIALSIPASRLVTVVNAPGNDGTGIVTALAATHLAGGLDGPTWTKQAAVPATSLTDNVVLKYWLTNHTIAVRITLGGLAGQGYTGTPDSWPASARATVYSGGTVSTVGVSTFNRTSSTAPGRLLNYAGIGMGGTHPELSSFIYEYSSNAGATWTAFTGGPFTTPQSQVNHANGDVNVTSFRYRMKVIGPDGDTGFVTDGIDYLLQPEAPTGITVSPDLGGFGGGHIHHVDAVTNQPGGITDAKARHLPAGAFTGFSAVPVDLDVVGGSGIGTPGVDDGDVEVTVRTSVTAFTVTDRTSVVVTPGVN